MTSIGSLLDAIEWKLVSSTLETGGLPYVKHEGVLNLGGATLRVYQLSNGQRIISSEDLERLFEERP